MTLSCLSNLFVSCHDLFTGERDRERDRQTDRQTDRDRGKQRERKVRVRGELKASRVDKHVGHIELPGIWQ